MSRTGGIRGRVGEAVTADLALQGGRAVASTGVSTGPRPSIRTSADEQ